MPKPKLCKDCGERPKKRGHPLWCDECWLRRQPADIRANRAARRLAAVPEELRVETVPAEVVPRGRRWCRGCQCFVLFEDMPAGQPRCITCTSARAHAAHVRRTFGVEYDRMYKRQGGKCAGCGNEAKKVRLAVDHNHKTGKVRGLLCGRCNHEVLGKVESLGPVKGAAILRALADYLENDGWSGKPVGFAPAFGLGPWLAGVPVPAAAPGDEPPPF